MLTNRHNLGNFLKKFAILVPLAHIWHVFRAIWKNYHFTIWKPIEKF